MTMDSDDESPVAHAPSVSLSRPAGFNFDDAFSDTDDHDDSFDFSPAAIRAELQKNLSSHGAQGAAQWVPAHDHDLNDLLAKIGYANGDGADPDASVSTFDINSSYSNGLPPPERQPYSPEFGLSSQPSEDDVQSFDDVTLASELSSVNLQSPQADPDETPELHGYDEPDDPQYAEYPAVHIDMSLDQPVPTTMEFSPPPSRTPVRSPSPPSTPPHDEQISSSNTSTGSHPVTPHSAHSASVPSLPMTASTSLPTPSSARSDASVHSASSNSRHRSSRSVGPSMLDKVISKTRPTYLPPKPKAEDQKHLADWEHMMKRSRAAEEKRRKALQERRFARERRVEDSLAHWEKEIVPDWTVVQRNPKLRKMWWQGIPAKLRATMWQNAVGNSLALSKDAHKACLARANRALSSGTFPLAVLTLIENDITTTLPALHLFKPGTGPMYQDLKDMLCAWVVARSDEGLGYIHGVAKIAAMILLNMAPPQGFVVMRNLLERHCMRSFYGGQTSKDDVEAYYRIFDTLLADGMPKIYFNFKQHQISPSSYLPDWLIPLYLNHLPFEACARLWDILLLEGDSFLFRASLAILAVLEARLFFPDRTELLELLKGENKAALEVAKRDGRPFTGAKYDIYGVDEETLWERIDSMEDWWRETTWTRLISRELPDL